jgi:Carboxypeptidase regulatory-like domain
MFPNLIVPGNSRKGYLAVLRLRLLTATGLLVLGVIALGSIVVAAWSPVEAQTVDFGTVHGVVRDVRGEPVAGAGVTLRAGRIQQTAATGEDGSFDFSSVPAGSFSLSVQEKGMDDELRNGTLKAGETLTLDPAIMMHVARVTTQVVVYPADELARMQVHEQEKQRLIGVIPNFYVVYDLNAPPMPTRSKYHLAWKNLTDPVSIALVAANAGFEQSQNEFSGFGPGPGGYGKRFGAGMADLTIGSMLSSAILPQVFKQDPRYFYKGTGSVWSRTKYALTRGVVCKGDNGKWQPCYSNVLGQFGTGALSNLYYPASDRHGAALTFENGAISVGYTAVGNLMQEFVLKRFTPKKHNHGVDLP